MMSAHYSGPSVITGAILPESTANYETMSTPRLVILLKASRGHHIVDVRTVLYAEAETRYSRLHFVDGTKKAVFHTLGELEAVLGCGKRVGDLLFLRVHRSHIVALHHLERMEGRYLFLNGSRLPVSRQHWPQMIKTISSIHHA